MPDYFCSYTWMEKGVTRKCRNAAKIQGGWCESHKQALPESKKKKWTIPMMQARVREWAMEAAKNINHADESRIMTTHTWTEEELKEIFS